MYDYIAYDDMMVEEKIVLTFPFSDELPTGVTLSGTPTVTTTVVAGVDATPSAFVSSSQISGSDVLVAVDGQVASVTYELRVTCPTTNASLVLGRIGRIEVV